MAKKTARQTWEQEAEAMTLISNIQTMQTKLYGKCFDYEQFNGNTLEELRNLQDSLIPEWNKAVKG